MKSDTLKELYGNAEGLLCPRRRPEHEDEEFGACCSMSCMWWREKAVLGRAKSSREDPPVDYYEGWCGLAGAPGDEHDYRSKGEI